MKAGQLTDIIEFYKPYDVTTDYGNIKKKWEFHYRTRASILYNSGYRTLENYEIVYPTTKTFIVRHYVNVIETMRIKYDGKYYQITSIKKNKLYNNIEIIADLVNE